MQTMMQPTRKIALVVLAIALALPALATRVRRLELTEVRDNAVAVIAGQVVGVSQRVGDTGKMTWTDYEIVVSETLRGPDPGDTTVMSFAGGTVGDLSIGIPGVPKLEIGKHYIFFVGEGSLHPMPTVGWGQGLFRLETVKVGGANRKLVVTIDGEPLQISENGKLMRGPLVKVEDGVVTDVSVQPLFDPSHRAAEPVWTSADGSILVQPLPEQAALPAARVFATYDDLRLFVQGNLEAERGRGKKR